MLEISLRRADSIIILDLAGDIDVDSSDLIEKIGWCLAQEYTDIICNFENVNLLNYTGLSVLTVAYKNVLNHKGRISFIKIPAHIKKILAMVGLDTVFEIYEDEETALKCFEEDRIIAEIQRMHLRRRFKRLPIGIGIEFKAKGEAEFNEGKVLNISAVGILLFAEKTYPLGQPLDIRLKLLPKPGLLELTATVVWLVQKEIQPQIYPGMGIEFHTTDSQTQKNIIAFVERNLPLSSTSECP
ncbi:MAG: STAS domain-containing protein [Candidatus Omnitrophota bacterium]|jgi:anti-sigma B factor antagonist|nr:MAG: STAS domain-containing protein [Candidatus Omnitrophota bacterium]